MTSAPIPHGPLRSFGRIKSRPVKPRQQALLDTLLPEIAVPQGPFQPLDLMPDAKAVWLASTSARSQAFRSKGR